ncbi:hypothetical protein JAAARDRAFT_30590 [Jaapia argillacea MUCL 33604]|uniref:BTB domain-containing protein n=1 Tax=Jaapia argillacea MUCL 33604 TaxID=933084 RepID=A0A067Q6T6_9AGAM|nr:hypothetical protein JAAARDRAFT_30590 [Jaapia argillacea MUCL 33604]
MSVVYVSNLHKQDSEMDRDHGTSRKRPRLDDEDVVDYLHHNEEELDHPVIKEPGVIRDDTYYMSDGSCILRVENTLFNVHRTILSRDSSSFGSMFTFPQGDNQEEGMSDDNPIILIGDAVSEFKNFLWALYALPPELMIVHTPQANLPRLIDIARVANKYSYKSVETWSLDAIQEFVNRKPSPILAQFTNGASVSSGHDVTNFKQASEQITRLITLAQLCNHERLLTTMILLLRQLMTSTLQYAYLAMTLADELNLRVLKGAAYLEVMSKAKLVAKHMNTLGKGKRGGDEPLEGTINAKGRLVVTPDQHLRLLCGYHGLSRTWEQLRGHPPTFEHASSCGATWHQHGCTQSWLEFWKEKSRGEGVLALGLADVLGRLRAIAKEFDKWGSATYMHHDCRMNAKRCIQEKIKHIEDALPDYFSEMGECDI